MANNLTGGGSVTYTTGKFGSALQGGGYGQVANFLPTTGTFTWEGWVALTSTAGVRVAFGASNTGWVGVDASGNAQARYGVGGTEVTLTTTVSIVGGAYHHVEVDFGAFGAKFFVDGVLAASSATTLAASNAVYTSNFGVSVLTGAIGTYDWGGNVDEVAVWSTTQHAANFTPATAAYSNSASGLVALYHFENNLTDSATLAAGATAVTLSLSASTGPTGSPVTVTISTDQLLTGAQSESIALTSNVAGAFSTTTVTLNSTTTSTTVTFTPSATGIATITGTATGTPTLTAGTAIYTASAAVNNALTSATASVLFSPYNWNIAANTAKTINSGAYFRVLFGGTACTLNFDMTGLIAPYPQISYRVNAFGAWNTVTLSASVPITIPSATTGCADKPGHFLEFVVKSTTQTQNRWTTQATGISLTGIILDAGKALSKPPARTLIGLYYGDSITEGTRTANAGATDTDWGDGAASAAYLSGLYLGAEIGMVGFGAMGWITGNATMAIPAFTSSYNFIYSGVARSFATSPDFICINMGTNDGGADVTTATTTVLNGLLSSVSASTNIIVLRPYNGSSAATIQAGIAACSAPSRIKYVDTTGWFNTANSPDALHPYGSENLNSIAPKLAIALRPYTVTASIKPAATKTIAVTFQNKAGTTQASLIGLKWEWQDTLGIVIDSGTGATTNASGVFSVTSVHTNLAAAGVGYLKVTNSSGAVNTTDVSFNGAVAVA